MKFFRVFAWDGESADERPGGPLFVPSLRQGSGRHDNPDVYTAFYASREPVSCIAEAFQPFRNQELTHRDLERGDGLVLALASYELKGAAEVRDLDDPGELSARGWRPSRVATLDRRLTQRLAATLFEEGLSGFLWWSVLESLWINATLFLERVRSDLELAESPTFLFDLDEEVEQAVRRLGIRRRW